MHTHTIIYVLSETSCYYFYFFHQMKSTNDSFLHVKCTKKKKKQVINI